MASSLHRYFTESLKCCLQQQQKMTTTTAATIQEWHLPESMETLSSNQYHEMLGCSSSSSSSSSPNDENGQPQTQQQQVQVPSWLTILRKLTKNNGHHHQTMFDRQLPAVHLLLQTKTAATTAATKVDAVNVVIDDERETARRSSWKTHRRGGRQSNKQERRRIAVADAAVEQRISILVLTGPSLAADSRPFQKQIAQTIQTLFQQLLLLDDDDDEAASLTTRKQVRVRAIPATDLLPSESSRLVIEGFLPEGRRGRGKSATNSTATSSSNNSPVVLAYLSNMQDYCIGREIRHGTTKEGLHVLHGMICSVNETMDWMCRHRASDPYAVTLPRCLCTNSSIEETTMASSEQQQQQPQQQPQQRRILHKRRVVVKANGRKVVQDIKTIPASTPATTTKQKKQQKQLRTTHTQSDRATTPFGAGVNHHHPPYCSSTPAARIRAEALSMPYSFLPLFYTNYDDEKKHAKT